MPLNDPIGTVVVGSDGRNISALLINGEPREGEAESSTSTWPPCAARNTTRGSTC